MRKLPPLTITCDNPTCGKAFKREGWRVRATKHHYCSSECCWASGRANANRQAKIPCSYCGQVFTRYKSRLGDYSHHFCCRDHCVAFCSERSADRPPTQYVRNTSYIINHTALSDAIAIYRQKHGHSQRAFGALVGLPQSTIWRIEACAIDAIPSYKLERIHRTIEEAV